MSGIRVEETKKVDLQGGVVIEGLGGIGWVSTIASACLISSLVLEPVGTLESDSFPSLAMIYSSEPYAPARIYADEKKKLSVFIAEFSIERTLERPLAETIVKWSQDSGASLIITSTGLPLQEGEQISENREVFGVGSTPRIKSIIEKVGIRKLEFGAVPGISGILLVEGKRLSLDVAALLVASSTGKPDHMAGAKVGEAIGRIVPHAKCEIGPLVAQAKRTEDRLKEATTRISQPSGGFYA